MRDEDWRVAQLLPQSPLSCASRPFIGPILKVAFGSILPVRRAVRRLRKADQERSEDLTGLVLRTER